MNQHNPQQPQSPDGPAGRVGTVAIVGRPNVGKSTLLNRLLGEKLAIVSGLPQTTRNRILGVKTWDRNQLVLIDTPGIHRRRANINRFMVREALDALAGVDCVVLMTEVTAAVAGADADELVPALHPDDVYVLEQVERTLARESRPDRAPVLVAINKIDRLRDRRALLPIMEGWRQRGLEEMVPISAQEGDGVEELLDLVLTHLPVGPLLYPEDTITDRPERFLCAELIREQIFRHFHQEIPYATAVEVVSFEERPERGDVRLEAVIFVERDSQKAIVIGKGGAAIKQIGTHARLEISRLLGCPVHLQLTVRVAEGWTRSEAGRRRFGYEP